MYFGTKILDLDLLQSHSRNEVLVLVLLLGDWEQNGTEAYPSGTFYFDTLRMPSLHLYLFGENFEISDQKLKKQVAELLILSKMDYADAVFRPLSLKLQKRLQKVENAAASFVLGRYTKEKDVVSLGWLPMKERRDWHLAKLAFKYISDRNKPEYIDISLKENNRHLRSSSAPLIATSTDSKTLRNIAAEIFNKMPIAIRNSKTKADFSSKSKEHFFTEAKKRLLV